VDADTIRAMLVQHFEHAESDPELAHAMYHEDAVLEFPQSGERFEGVESFREWRSAYPTPTTPEITRIRGADDIWVAELAIAYGGAAPSYGVTILELRDGKIARETIYVSEGWDAPDWRAQWRAAAETSP
jgi:SnoaL-like domain